MDLTREDSGARRTAQVGERVTVTLPENPTTGYRWQLAMDPDAFHLVEDRYTGSSDAPGAGGSRRLTFTVRRAGLLTLRLVKRRAWEQSAVDEFAVAFDVGAR